MRIIFIKVSLDPFSHKKKREMPPPIRRVKLELHFLRQKLSPSLTMLMCFRFSTRKSCKIYIFTHNIMSKIKHAVLSFNEINGTWQLPSFVVHRGKMGKNICFTAKWVHITNFRDISNVWSVQTIKSYLLFELSFLLSGHRVKHISLGMKNYYYITCAFTKY